MQKLIKGRLFVAALMLGLTFNLAAPKKSEAMVIVGTAGMFVGGGGVDILAGGALIGVGLLVSFITGNPIPLILDTKIDVNANNLTGVLAARYPFIDDQELNADIATILKAKFDANQTQGFNQAIGLTDAELDQVLSSSPQILTAEQRSILKKDLQ